MGRQEEGNEIEEEQEEQRGKEEKKSGWLFLERNQKEVAKRILGGNYHMVKPGNWGFLDKFLVFLNTLGIWDALDIKGEKFVRKMYDLSQIVLTYDMKILLGISSMNQVPDLLFKDIGLLQVLGFTAEQVKNGFCKRGEGKHIGPMHKDTLADALDKFTPEEVEQILATTIKILARKNFILDKAFIIDSTDIETTEKCIGRGCKTVKEKKVKNGEVVEIETTKYGFKVILMRGVESNIVVAAKVLKIQEHESNYLIDLILKAQENLNRKKLGVLLIDRGFIDGINLWKVKNTLHMDFIVPAKTNMEITKDARGLREMTGEGIYRALREKMEKEKIKDKNGNVKVKSVDRGIEVVGIEGLCSYGQYGDEEHFRMYKLNQYKKEENQDKKFSLNSLNVVMVTKWDGKKYEPGKEKVFITTLSVDKPLEIIDLYDLRSLIENTTFRELKQGWLINKVPKKTENAVTTHVLLTLCMFSLTNAYRSERGILITQKGIRSYRIKTFAQTKDKVIIIAEPYYAIFDLEELMVLVGKPPQEFFNIDPEKFKREYGLP